MAKKVKVKLKPDRLESFGRKIKGDRLCVTDYGRLVTADLGGPEEYQCALIICSVEELIALGKEASKFKRSELFKNKIKGKVPLFYRHLSPDVTFGLVEQDSPYLTELKGKKDPSKKRKKK